MFNKSAVIVAAMALAQLAAAGLNAFIEPAASQAIDAGKPFTISWKPDGGKTVTITLRKGDSKNLDTLEDIASKFLPNVCDGSSLGWRVAIALS